MMFKGLKQDPDAKTSRRNLYERIFVHLTVIDRRQAMRIKRIKTVSRKDIYRSLLGRWKQMVFSKYCEVYYE